MTFGRRAELGAAGELNLARQIVLDQKNATCTFKIACPCEVDLDTIRTEGDLLACVLRLQQQPWIKREHLAFFVRTVARYKRFNLRLPLPPHYGRRN